MPIETLSIKFVSSYPIRDTEIWNWNRKRYTIQYKFKVYTNNGFKSSLELEWIIAKGYYFQLHARSMTASPLICITDTSDLILQVDTCPFNWFQWNWYHNYNIPCNRTLKNRLVPITVKITLVESCGSWNNLRMNA